MKQYRIAALAAALAVSVCALSAESVGKEVSKPLSFVAYASLGAGLGMTSGWVPYPAAESAFGVQLAPWFSLGGFSSVSPLSPFDHARFGVKAADADNSFALASGTELLFTPFDGAVVHPLIRATIGGRTVGTLKDSDGKEGFDAVDSKRYFYAGLGIGPEVTVAPHTRLYLRVGGSLTPNGEIAGLGKAAMSGMEVSVGARFVWRMTVE